MTVVVTGGAGYVGSQVVRRLCDSGEAVVVIDNLSTGLRENVDARARLLELDVGDAPALRDALGHCKACLL